MKKIRIILLVLLMVGFSVNTYAVVSKGNGHGKHKVVGTPLDGGLLTILGAAGVSYYLIRKKKKATE